MQRIKFNLSTANKHGAVRFLYYRGYAVRHLYIKVDWKFGTSMKYFLRKLVKLTELRIEGDDYDEDDEDDDQELDIEEDKGKDQTADLSNLRILKVHHICDLNDLIKYSKNLTNLTNLIAKFGDDDNHDSFTDFLCCQEKLVELNLEDSNDDFEFPNRDISESIKFKLNKLQLILPKIHKDHFISFLGTQASTLQVLELETSDSTAFNFPSRDISRDINLNLKVFKISCPVIHNEYFKNFLRTQALCLEELELNLITHSATFEMIFINFKVLKKLTIDEDGSETIFHEDFPQNLTLDSLQTFHDKNQNGTIVRKLINFFPNLETLKGCDTMQANGTSESIQTFDVSEVYWPRIRNFKMPNLKNLFIKKIDRCDDRYYWSNFCNNFLNVENITIEKIGNEVLDTLRLIKSLKKFTKLKTFKLRHGNAIAHDYKLDENERVEEFKNDRKERVKFFKILLDIEGRTIKISSYIVKNCKKEMKLLKEFFNGFEFFEFCFEELKIQKIEFFEEESAVGH